MRDVMNIIPLASDSMGTRSMATFLETRDCKVLIDPAVALGPIRYGLAPHIREERKLDVHSRRINSYAKKSNVLIVTHYHYDHHDPDEPEIFKGKVLLTKHSTENINKSQKKRSAVFLESLEGIAEKIEYSDGNEYKFGRTKIRFSEAVPHGSNTKLGYVTEVCIRDGRQRFLYTSDVQGPNLDEQTDFILNENPELIFCDGPMTYMLGFRYSKKSLEESIQNLIKIVRETKVKKLVLDHHLLRDLKWKERIQDVFLAAKEGKVNVMTIADFCGKRNLMLEARRKELWGTNGRKVKKKRK
jgi:predicted metallo-beta-lactamase superfamily hydrolase